MARVARSCARATRRSTLRDLGLGLLAVAILAALVGLATQGVLQAPVRTGAQWRLRSETPGMGDFDLGRIPMHGDYVVGRAPLRHVRTLCYAPGRYLLPGSWYLGGRRGGVGPPIVARGQRGALANGPPASEARDEGPAPRACDIR